MQKQAVPKNSWHVLESYDKKAPLFPIDFFRTAFALYFYPNGQKKSMTL
jgi:hypothetical protein